MAQLSEHIKASVAQQEQYLGLHGQTLARAAQSLAVILARGGKLIAVGSPTVCQHMVAELTGRFQGERPGLAAIALADNPSALTAIANDYGRESIYARQLEALAKPGDFVLAMMAGIDPASHQAVSSAHKLGLETLVLEIPGCDESVALETFVTAAHLICEGVEDELRRIRPEWFDLSLFLHTARMR